MPSPNRKNIYSEIKAALFKDLVRPLLKSGGALPSKRDLAERYKVNIGTLDKALQELSLEGYIEKRMGSGTYVLPQTEKACGSLGVYFAVEMRGDLRVTEFNHALYKRLLEHYATQGQELRHYIDIRPDSFRGKPLPQLIDDIESRKLNCLIVARPDWRYDSWLEQLRAPVISTNHDYGWGAVALDMKQGGFLATRKLIEKGCKSIQLLSVISNEWQPSKETALTSRPLRAGMANALMPEGLPAPEPWMTPDNAPPAALSTAYPFDHEKKGYELCKALFKTMRPDGIVIYTDVMAIGVARALEELGLEPGKNVHCAILGNKGMNFPENAKFLKVELDPEEMASSMAGLADAALSGKEPRNIFLKYS